MSESFNYIAFGHREYAQSLDVVEMARGRMFEYTATDLERRLESLDDASTAFLEKLPTFVCSEIGSVDGHPSMIVRYGRIENVVVESNEVKARFTPLIDFGEVPFDTIEEAIELFNADRLQVYRTHWAVRTGTPVEILERLALRRPDLGKAVEAGRQDHEVEGEDVDPPERIKRNIGSVDSVEAFIKLLSDHPPGEGTETFFRGHNHVDYKLTPSLLRKTPDGAWRFMDREERLCKELLIAHYDEFQSDTYCFDTLVRMQHFGLPTRLLDISGNPLIALFFACSGHPDDLDGDGEVIVFRVGAEEVKYYDSDTVSCIANLSKLTYELKNTLDFTLPIKEFNQAPVVQKLLHHIKSEKGFFEGRIEPVHLGSILCVKAKQTNSRIRSQSGAFLLFGHEARLPEDGLDEIQIQRVTVTDKRSILQQLDSLNINARTVYPSIDQTARHLSNRDEF